MGNEGFSILLSNPGFVIVAAKFIMPALARTAPPPASVDIRLEDATSRLVVTLKGALSGRQVAESLSRAYLAQPEVTYFDMLFDLTEYEGAVEAQHVEIILAAYLRGNQDPLHPCRTAFVTADPFFDLWAAAMSFQFIGREHRAFPTFESAKAFLAQPFAERPPFRA